MKKKAADLVAEPKSRVEDLDPDAVEQELQGGDALLVDIRDSPELEENGSIPGVHAPRGMLEFYADPTSPYHRDEFDPSRRTILYCASGGRSALGAVALQDLGYTDVAHLDGGMKAWTQTVGAPTTE